MMKYTVITVGVMYAEKNQKLRNTRRRQAAALSGGFADKGRLPRYARRI